MTCLRRPQATRSRSHSNHLGQLNLSLPRCLGAFSIQRGVRMRCVRKNMGERTPPHRWDSHPAAPGNQNRDGTRIRTTTRSTSHSNHLGQLNLSLPRCLGAFVMQRGVLLSLPGAQGGGAGVHRQGRLPGRAPPQEALPLITPSTCTPAYLHTSARSNPLLL